MALPEWVRRLGRFDPGYGKCGGYSKDCSPNKPVDQMDELFQEHDYSLWLANQVQDKKERELARDEADKLLGEGLRKVDPKKLSWKGRIYRRFAMIIFRP